MDGLGEERRRETRVMAEVNDYLRMEKVIEEEVALRLCKD